MRSSSRAVGANTQLRTRLQRDIAARRGQCFPPPDLCTDNGAMIALAGLAQAKRSRNGPKQPTDLAFSVHPRWTLAEATH